MDCDARGEQELQPHAATHVAAPLPAHSSLGMQVVSELAWEVELSWCHGMLFLSSNKHWSNADDAHVAISLTAHGAYFACFWYFEYRHMSNGEVLRQGKGGMRKAHQESTAHTYIPNDNVSLWVVTRGIRTIANLLTHAGISTDE